MRWLLLFPAVLFIATAHAERATERYAPAQLSVAQDLLERARAAAALEDHNAAAAYAQQAEVDARIAWGMTDASARSAGISVMPHARRASTAACCA